MVQHSWKKNLKERMKNISLENNRRASKETKKIYYRHWCTYHINIKILCIHCEDNDIYLLSTYTQNVFQDNIIFIQHIKGQYLTHSMVLHSQIQSVYSHAFYCMHIKKRSFQKDVILLSINIWWYDNNTIHPNICYIIKYRYLNVM